MIFNARRTNNFEFNIGGHNIEITHKYKYLGVLFSNSGSFLNARKHIIEQLRKAMHLLFIRANNLDIPLDLQIKLFDNTVLPILTFSCEILGYENTEMIERVHIEFLRKITRVRKSTPKYMIYGELGRFPLDIIIKQRMLSFWTRMLTNKTTKLSYQIYKYLLNSPQINSKWIVSVQTLLSNAGRQDIWLIQNKSTPKSTGKLIKQTLIDQFFQQWNSQLYTSSKGRNYSIFKIVKDTYIF